MEIRADEVDLENVDFTLMFNNLKEFGTET